MGSETSSYVDYGKYQASLEDLSFRNRSILLWFSFGIIWLFLNIFVFNILWFWEEFYFAISEVGWQVVTENSDGTQCVVTCLLYTSPSPRDATLSRMPSSA